MISGDIERDYEIAKTFGLQILDACLQDIAFARFLLKKNHERRQKLHEISDRRQTYTNISKIVESNNQYEFERSRDVYVDLNQAILAVSSTSSSGVSMLHIMAYKDLSKQLQLLLDFGANPYLTNKNQETALHWCAKLTSKRCAKVLLDHFCKNKQIEAALSIRDASNSTPLHAAVAAGNLAIIPLFVDYLDMQFTSRESEHSEKLEKLNASSPTSSSPFLITDIDNCTPIMIASNYARATAHAITAAANMESEIKRNGQDSANKLYFDDDNVFIAITFLLLRYHQQRGLPIPPEALSISNSVVKSLSVPSTAQTIESTNIDGLKLDLSQINGFANRLRDVKSSPQLSVRVNDKNESHFATPSLDNCYPADLDADAVDLLIDQLNDQHQYLLDQKRLIKHDSPDLPTVVVGAMQKAPRPRTAPKSHKPKEFHLRRENDSTADVAVPEENDSAAPKQKVLPVIAREPIKPIILQSRSSSTLRESPPTAYTVVGGELVPTSTSPSAVYEGIIAKYRQQQVSTSRPTSAVKTKLASISFKKAQQDAAAASRSPLKPIRKDSSSPPKKPAFFVRRSDALHHMPAAIVKPSILDGLRIDIDEDNKVDLDLEIFMSMVKQAKVVSAEPLPTSAEKTRRRTSMMQSFSSVGSIGSFAEPFETRASLDPRMAKKLMSAMPKYDMLFPPAPSVPFLPTKTRRIPSADAATNDILSAIAQATAAVQSQSPDKKLVQPEPYYSKRMDVIVIVEHCCDCEQHCTQSLRHDPKKYVQMANDVLYSIIEFVSSSSVSGSNGDDHCPVRLFCMRTKPLTADRIGAFEVTVAINITPPMQPSSAAAVLHHHPYGGGAASVKRGSPGSLLRRSDAPHLRQNPIVDEEESIVDSLWATNLIYSKLQTKSWPSVSAIQKKVEQFLSVVQNGERAHDHFHSTIQESNSIVHKDTGGQALSEEEIQNQRMAAKVRAIEDSYRKWVDRMRIPPKVEKHNLDLEWPTTAMKKRAPGSLHFLSPGTKLTHGGASDSRGDTQHPLGPYIDFKLLGALSTTGFEDAVLRHFEVLDTT